MKYKLVQKANPQNREKKKWYANSVNQGSVSQHKMAQIIASKSSLTQGDVLNVIQNLLEEMPKILMDGKSINLEGLGSFRLTIASEGTETEKDFSTSSIKGVKVVFTPSMQIKKEISQVKFERV